MKVLKRDNTFEDISFDKVLNRLRNLCDGITGVNPDEIAQKVCSRIYDGVKTSELDELAAQLCAGLVTTHPDDGILASRIIISNHHKNTSPSFSETILTLKNNKDIQGNDNPLISKELWEIVQNHKEKLNTVIDYSRDFLFDYFGFKTLERSYLSRVNGRIIERPQHMWMRVALGIHGNDIKEAIETYDHMSKKLFTHATPTLFNAGTETPQLASCFLLGMEDSVDGMYRQCLSDCAQISKNAGGIGIHIHDIRAKNSYIRGTNGKSSGIIPLLRVYNQTALHINQGGRRNGSIAIYLEPWHADIESFLELRKNHGNEEERCRDLFTALWIPDLFMKRVQENSDWTLMCPDECKGLSDVYGDKFEKLYTEYEEDGKFRKKVKAQQLWYAILKSQIETGTPYLLYKDSINKKSNQQNIGTIHSSNLCCEITEYSSPTEYATCNLASIALPSFIKYNQNNEPYFDFIQLHDISEVLTRNINKIIDRTYYPVYQTEISNKRHRPIGLGVQGLADTYALMKYAFDSPEAATLNRCIFETIYHGSLTASMKIAKKRTELIDEMENINTSSDRKSFIKKYLNMIEDEELNTEYRGAYSTFIGSPAYHGKLQFDLWEKEPEGNWNWESLKEDIKKWGLRNSLLLAPMPTASTSQILGFNECFEPFTNNIYQRQTLAGEFTLINKYLIKDLLELKLWNTDMKNKILTASGSIQNIDEIPDEIKLLYKTVWEIKQKVLIDQSAERGKYVCQSQSLNLFVEDPDFNKLTAMHFYAWKQGLKTGIYYLRTRPKAKVSAFTIEPVKKPESSHEEKVMACRRDNPESCVMCSS
jgi:ribonucleoside-diphosphate reductase alpha chain